MARVEVHGTEQLRELSARLREAGTEGKGLKRELFKAINEAAEPLAAEISDVEHLKIYMPDRYAEVLATDLRVRARNSFGKNPSVELRAVARQHKRKVAMLDAGRINHPVFARGPRRGWRWSNAQTRGMRAGFFSDVVDHASPQVRDRILQAMTETARKITGHG